MSEIGADSQFTIHNSQLLDSILEVLDLSRAEPGIGFLEALFARFTARVPFENASKIVRNAEVADPEEKLRRPGVFWADHLESGSGGTCFARVAAFDALLQAIGFSTRKVLGRVERDHDHAALMVDTPAGEAIVDVGFPLPAILRARPGELETPLGGLRVEETQRGFRIAYTGGVPEGPRTLEIFSETVEEEQYLAIWGGTFAPGGRFLRGISLRRDLGNRVLSFSRGELRVDDLHSRLRIPLAAPRDAALAELFGMDRALLSRAFAIAPEDASGSTAATLTAYLEVGASPEKAMAAIATRVGYRRLLEGVGEIVGEEETAGGFRLRMSAGAGAPPEASVEEEVSADPSARGIRILRRAGNSTFESSYRVEQRDGRTYLIREATLSGPREDLLRNDSLRGRFAGGLAVDLLAWARLL